MDPHAPSSSKRSADEPDAGAVAQPKRRKPTAAPKEPVEKRAARYRKSCPKNIIERVERVMSQRMYMIQRDRVGDELKETFQVLGSTGNVYTVTVDQLPRCNCPDAVKGNHCKHILFVMLKVLGQPLTSTHYYQKALLTSDLQDIFASAPRDATVVASERVRQAYAGGSTSKEDGAAAGSAADAGAGKKRLPEEGDSCPICFEDLDPKEEDKLWFDLSVAGCGNALHKDCYQQWVMSKRSKGEVTCVYCRATLDELTGSGKGKAPAAAVGVSSTPYGEYQNLAHVSGQQRSRDTSSYYHGPRRGESYWAASMYKRYDGDW